MAYKIPIKKARDMAEAFWINGDRRFGHTARGVRDEITTDEKGNVHYFLWGNKIAEHNKQKNVLIVTDAGWQTKTTKDRLNSILAEKRLGRISQKAGKWFIERDDKKFEWSGKETFALDNPEKHLKLFEEKKARLEVKEEKKQREAFVEKKFKENDYFLELVLRKRGYREPYFFLRDKKANEKIIKDALRWYWKQPQSIKDEVEGMLE